MAHKKSDKIEMDVSLNLKKLDEDFDKLLQKAKSGTKAVVRVMGEMDASIEKTETQAKESGKEMRESVDKTSESVDGLSESTEEWGKTTQKTSQEQEVLGEQTEETRKEVEKSANSFLNWGNIVQSALKGVVVVAGVMCTSLVAGAGAAVSFGTEYKKASNTIQASTGATKDEMQGLSDVMKKVYANNFGEDMNDVADGVAAVKKYLGGTNKEIQKATEKAFVFRDTFGYEIPESTRAASAIMKNFGGDVEHAYDLMAKGIQNGLDFSGELLDSIDEYSVQFKKAGFTAEEMFNVLSAGYEAGAWNLDKIGDAVKELNVRLVDGSDATKEGLKAIGLNADEVAKKMSQGGETANKTYKEVVTRLAQMKDEQKQNIAGVNLFGTMWEDLGPEVVGQLATLKGAYSDVKGTMNAINAVKYDDASAALEALKRKTETSLLLPISEDILPTISSATDAAIGYIEEMADAYESEGVNGLVKETGKIFSEIITEAAKQSPKMAEVAMEFIEQTAVGLSNNKNRLIKAGANFTKALAGAAVKLLPTELQEPVEDAVEDLVDSLTKGGIKKGVETFGRMFERGFEAVTKVTKTILPPFVKIIDKTADNMDILIPLVIGGATAFEGYSVVQTVTKNMQAMSGVVATLTALETANTLQTKAATGALGAKEIAVGVLTGKISLVTAATAAWNAVMNANPIGLLVTGVVAAGAAIIAYKMATDDSAESTYKLSKEEQALIDKAKEEREAYEELRKERERQFEKITTEYAYTQSLADELQSIVNKNGKIKKGYEERASVITGLLSDALGIEIEITDGVIDKYDELKTSIDQVILTKKAEAALSISQEDYTEAILNQTGAYLNYADAQKKVEETVLKLKDAQEKLSYWQEREKELRENTGIVHSYTEEQKALKKEIEILESTLESYEGQLKDTEEVYIGYVSTIQNHEGMLAAMATGEAKEIEEAMLLLMNSFITAENGTKESLEQQVANMEEIYDELAYAIEQGAPGVRQQMVDDAAFMVEKAREEYAKLVPKTANEIKKIGPTVEEELDKSNLSGKLRQEGRSVGDNFAQGFSGGITGGLGSAIAAAANMASKAIEAVQRELDSHSPSRETGKLGTNFVQGFAFNIVKMTATAVSAATDMGKKSLEAVKKNMNMSELDADTMMYQAEYVVQSRIVSYAAPFMSGNSNLKSQTKEDNDVKDVIDYDRLERIQLKAATRMSKRPIYLGTERIDKPLPEGAVPVW